jgi:hypothetical protein
MQVKAPSLLTTVDDRDASSLCDWPQIKSLQASMAQLEKTAQSLGDPAVQDAVLERLRHARDVVRGLGPGGDLCAAPILYEPHNCCIDYMPSDARLNPCVLAV